MPDSSKSNLRNLPALLRFVGLTVLGLAADLWTKAWAVQHLKDQPPQTLIPGWIHLTYTENLGAVFGLGQGQRLLFIIVSLAAIAFLTYLFAWSGRRWFYQALLGILLAGVLGNMYDRISLGHVRDMIHALPGIYWPDSIRRLLPANVPAELFPWIFNIADSLLCSGVFLMIVYSLIQKPLEQDEADVEPTSTNELRAS